MESAESTKKDVSCAQEKLQAAINALQKNDTSTNVYEDGTYDVSTLCIPDDDMDFSAYNLSMKVTIANDRIVSITDVKGDGDSQNVSYIKKAVDGTKIRPVWFLFLHHRQMQTALTLAVLILFPMPHAHQRL